MPGNRGISEALYMTFVIANESFAKLNRFFHFERPLSLNHAFVSVKGIENLVLANLAPEK